MRVAAIVVAGTIALASCSGAPGREPVRLQVFGDGAEIAAYRTLTSAFARRDRRASVELVAVPNQRDHVTKLSTSFSGGTPPDVFLINYRRFGLFASKDVLEPAGPHFQEGDFYPQALDAFRYRGSLLCIPQNISSLVVYYNRTLFSRAGVDPPKPGWTWQDFVDTAKRLTREGVYGVGTEPTLIRLAPLVWQAGAELVDDTEKPTRFTLLDEAAVRAMAFFIDLRRTHKVSPSKEEAAAEDYESRFTGGRLAMLLDSRRVTPTLREVRGLDWDVAPLPRDKEEATVLHSDAYCFPKASRHREAAMRFAEFALGSEGASILARTGRTVPSVRSVAESPAFLDSSKPPASARVFLDSIPSIRRVPNISTWNEIETKADVRVEEWYYGTEDPAALGIEIDIDTRDLFAGGFGGGAADPNARGLP